jgi:two-component system, sensor histidine kinase and response regulator
MDTGDVAARPLRIVIVEEHPEIRRFMRRPLEREVPGVEILEGGTGLDAIALRFLEPPPDLMIVDGTMPDLDGMDAIREIRLREREEGAHVPIVFETGHKRTHFSQESLDIVDAWLEKPFSTGAFLEVVRPFLPER